MKNKIKLIALIFVYTLIASKSKAQTHFGNIINFEILPNYLKDGKILLTGNTGTTNVQFKVSFSRIADNFPNWKPFNLKVVLGSYRIDDYGTVIGIDYFSSPYDVKSGDFPTGVGFLDKTFNATINNSISSNQNRRILLFFQSTDMNGVSYFNKPYAFVVQSNGGTPSNPSNPSIPVDQIQLGPYGSSGTISTMAGIDIGTDDGVYFWGLNGTVTKGVSTSIYGPSSPYILPDGKSYNMIIDIAVSKAGYAYVWYKDGTMSVGHITNLGDYIKPKSYLLPANRVPQDIVGISIDKFDDTVYTFYKDGTYSKGNSTDLGAYQTNTNYALPSSEPIDNLKSIGIAKSSRWFYSWYIDSKMSVGSQTNLNEFIPLKNMN